ncbi:lipoate--protein ligase [Clostridium sp. MCC353]|uniref:lipoate--protein ligase n=1 Tax=Clostridium sp. MCC353 TaxID=2592646 RepID=UPI001C036103|nr:lipoate--protein ligase [Clostridium sp. MCC353]MBT9777973.1 lipoate--protein ligase [Clostridium sp. MCC353]
MAELISVIESKGTNPYENLALEEYLLMHVRPGECILYLWQNRKTVVIGRNQNGWKECRIGRLEEDGGFLARRLSGGGAVFHDLGNLNFTFLADRDYYDVEKQTEVILRAVRAFGVQAERTGRNDLTVDGKKFSGHAFYRTGNRCYHHGTVLLQADMDEMSKYLNVSLDKLRSKSVDSVKSRVENLIAHVPDITVERMKQALIDAFEQVYGKPAAYLPEERLDKMELRRNYEKFSSWDWNYGRKIPFQYEVNKRFPWGGIGIQLNVNGGVIQEAAAYSDMLDTEFISKLEQALSGVPHSEREMAEAVKGILCSSPLQEEIRKDIAGCLTQDE